MTTDPAATRTTDRNRLFTVIAPFVSLALLVLSNLRLPGVRIAVVLLGTLTFLSVAWFAIGCLLRYVAKDSLSALGILRICVGTMLLVLVAAERL